MPETLEDRLVGHVSRDGTAIEAREKPAKKVDVLEEQSTEKKKRGRPGKDQTREALLGKLEQQQEKSLVQLLPELPALANSENVREKVDSPSSFCYIENPQMRLKARSTVRRSISPVVVDNPNTIFATKVVEQRQMTADIAMCSDLDLNVITAMPTFRSLQDQFLEPHTVVSTDRTLVLFTQGIVKIPTNPLNKC